MIISEVCEKFLKHCHSAISLSDHSLRAYRCDLKDIEKYLGSDKRIGAIDKDDLRLYIRHLRDQRKFKETSIKRRLACMKLLFRWAILESVIVLNPFDTLNERIRLPRRLPRALDRRDTARLRKEVTQATSSDSYNTICHKTAIHLLLDTGIRVGELASICHDDISISDKCIKIHGKGNRQRLVYLISPSVHSAVKRYLLMRKNVDFTSNRLFVSEEGKELTPPHIRVSLREVAAKSGIDRHVTPHMLRHTCATRWLEAGLDIRFVQKLLGHHSISTTEIYTHVSDVNLREALARVVGRQNDN